MHSENAAATVPQHGAADRPLDRRGALKQRIMLRIDGQYITTDPDRTILDVARENGIDIPTLCAIPGLTAVGACRLCLVEIKGNSRLLPACTVKVDGGMVVVTKSERLDSYRRMIVELLLAERNHVCAVCVSNGTCELQALATRLGVTHSPFAYRYPRMQVDATHERFVADPNRCILCNRCVRVCDEVEGAHTRDVGGRGIGSCIITDLADPWGSANSCTSCGKCVQVCPTGALSIKGSPVAGMRRRPLNVPDLVRMRGVTP
jgi:bidirectional [NiFe] hydrogenase diaphorase subunit